MAKRNSPPYLPSRAEIDARAEALDWMKEMGWSDALMDQIFTHDNPSLDEVRRIVYRVGPIKAVKVLMSFVEEE